MAQSFAFGLLTDGAGLGGFAICIYPLMAQSFAFGLLTDGAGLGGYTICIRPLMVQGCLLHISGVIARSAVLISIPTNRLTSRCLCVNLCQGMCRRDGIFALNVVAAGTIGIGGIAVLGTSSRLTIHINHIMIQSCLFHVGGIVAARTGHVGIPADLSTGRCLGFVAHFGMT